MPRSSSSEGFTLPEVLVALGLVSVLVTGAAGLLIAASGDARAARLRTTGTLLALQKAEQLSASASALSSGATQDYLTGDGAPTEAAQAAFIRRWTVGTESSSQSVAVQIEVSAVGAGRVAELQAMVGRESGS